MDMTQFNFKSQQPHPPVEVKTGIPSLDCFIIKYNKTPRLTARFGQFFVNCYIKSNWPELFYCEDNQKAIDMISKWLIDNQYEMSLPVNIHPK